MGRINIYMPSLGEGIIEASVIKLLKSVGDFVEQDDALVEIATDKVDSEIVASESGIVKEINVKSGDTIKVGEVVVVLETESLSEEYSPSVHGPEGEESFVLKKTSLKEHSGKKETGTGSDEKEAPGIFKGNEVKDNGDKSPMQEAVGHSEIPKKVFLSPLIKKIMREEGLTYSEVTSLKGSGYMGRITRDDVLKYIEYKKEGGLHGKDIKEISESSVLSKAKSDIEEKEIHTVASDSTRKSSVLNELSSDISGADYIEKEMDRVRTLIAEHTMESVQTAPHVTSFMEVDISNFKKIREENKFRFIDEYGTRLTYTTLFIAATAMALEKFPEINASLIGNNIRYYKHINIGIATALDNGNLIVPVIKNAEHLNLRGIAMELKNITTKARSNKLQPTDISGGTFTISNYGSFNTIAGTPIIVQPQSAILGIGEIRKRVVVIEEENGDSIGIRPMSILSLSFDHRIIDGALAGSFLGYLRECIENFKLT